MIFIKFVTSKIMETPDTILFKLLSIANHGPVFHSYFAYYFFLSEGVTTTLWYDDKRVICFPSPAEDSSQHLTILSCSFEEEGDFAQ